MILTHATLLSAGVAAAIIGIACLVLLARLPSDTGSDGVPLLRDPVLRLRGRPDGLFKERGKFVPIERKPTRRSSRLYDSDRLQLTAYLVALRGTKGRRAAPYGYVEYQTQRFRVDLSPKLEKQVQATVAAIRAGRTRATMHRSHSAPARCAGCAVHAACNEALTLAHRRSS